MLYQSWYTNQPVLFHLIFDSLTAKKDKMSELCAWNMNTTAQNGSIF